jgi:hypothetical protein
MSIVDQVLAAANEEPLHYVADEQIDVELGLASVLDNDAGVSVVLFVC